MAFVIDRRRVLLPLVLFALASFAFLPDAWAAAKSGAAGAAIIKSTSLVGPLGICPLLALGALGVAAASGAWGPPEGLEFIAHPVAIVVLLLLGALIQFGRSSKFTKPIAEALGTGESLIGVLAVGLLIVPHFSTPAWATAGLADGALMLTAGLMSVTAVIVLRTSLDVMTWLTPIPFVDAILQVLKALVTVGFVLLAVFFPKIAIALNLALLVATFLLLRWAVRTTRYGLNIAWDLTFGRFSRDTELPRDEVVPEDLGPFKVFALDVEGVKRRTEGVLHLDAGRWFLDLPRLGKGPRTIRMGEGEKGGLKRTLEGAELKLAGGTVLLPPRYNPILDALVADTALVVDAPQAAGAGQPRRQPIAAAH